MSTNFSETILVSHVCVSVYVMCSYLTFTNAFKVWWSAFTQTDQLALSIKSRNMLHYSRNTNLKYCHVVVFTLNPVEEISAGISFTYKSENVSVYWVFPTTTVPLPGH